MLGSFIVILFVLFGGSVGAVVFLHTQFGWEAVREVLVQELSRNLPGYRQENLLTQVLPSALLHKLFCLNIALCIYFWFNKFLLKSKNGNILFLFANSTLQ